jgi:C-terminal peptidase prc
MTISKVFLITVVLLVCVSALAYGYSRKAKEEAVFKTYVDYFKSVYDIMEKEYYLPVSKEAFEQYILDFKVKIYEKQVKNRTKIDNNIKHVGTGIMVSKLKDQADPFTNFFPPQMVKQFKESVLGYGGDVGLEGTLRDERFIITQVEPRSDAFKKGIAIGDEVLKVEGKPVAALSQEQIQKIFSPVVGKEVGVEVFFTKTKKTAPMILVSAQYFKQSVFPVSTGDPKVACLKIKFFNQETGNEIRDAVSRLNKDNIGKLVLDLRDNGGGPPLAAWDISGVFLAPQQRLFYFQRRQQPPSGLITSPSEIRYQGDVAILVNKGTGSASELFSGIMQAYRRAELIGQHTAGMVYLKSIFDLQDGASLELTVAKGYLFNGNPISADGLKPDVALPDDANLLVSAVRALEAAAPTSK